MIDLLRKILGQRILNYYHLATATIANFVYGFPSRKLHVIGVTGTDGKTTTITMIASILQAGGLQTAHLSTIDSPGLHTTTPSSFTLQRLLSHMVKAGNKYAVLEVTSHALDQYRTWGIAFETAVITNISHEHLDYHKDLEQYMKAKAKLFQNVEFGILNMDDQSYKFISTSLPTSLHRLERGVTSYGFNSKAAVWADQLEESLTETKFTAHTLGESFPVNLNLPGKFNVYNALAAISVAVVYDVPANAIVAGLAGVKGIPGRLEMIDLSLDPSPSPGEGKKRVMIDFAHTPNAIEKLLQFLRPKITGRIIHVFGSAGERDQTKRPLMGEAADKFADIIILTREDNRSEDANDICEQTAKGIQGKKQGEGYFIIPDRREAIRFALRLAQGSNDLVVITGKGHEQSLNVDGKEMPWDERRVIEEELKVVTSPASGTLSAITSTLFPSPLEGEGARRADEGNAGSTSPGLRPPSPRLGRATRNDTKGEGRGEVGN